MRNEQQIESLKTRKLSSVVKKTSDEVSNLPPAYIAGFVIEIENRQVTVGKGIAHVRGKRVVHKIPYRVNWGDTWSDITPQSGRKYFIYIDSGLTWKLDVIPPSYLDDAYAFYHPIHQDFRYIGVFSVDTQGDYVHDITIVGYYGRGTNDAPQNGDRRTIIDGDEVRIELRVSNTWVTKLKIAGTLVGATALLPMIACQGLYNIGNPPSTQLFPHPDFELYDFDGDYENLDGLDDWNGKTHAAFSSNYSKFGTESLTDDNAAASGTYTVSAYRTGDANLGESQCFAFWTKLRLVPTGTVVIQIANLYWDSDNYIEVRYNRVGDDFYYSLVVKKGGTLHTIKGGGASMYEEHHVGAVYDKDSDTIYFMNDGLVYSKVLGGSWGAAATCNFYVFPSFVALSTYLARCYISYLLTALDKYADPYYIAEQYVNGLSWDISGKTAEDMVISAGVDGRIWIEKPIVANSTLEIKEAGSEFYNPKLDKSAGTLKLMWPGSILMLDTNPANTDIQTLDITGWVPVGATAVIVLISIYESGGSTRYIRIYDDNLGSTTLARVSNFSTLAGFQQATIPIWPQGAYNYLYWDVSNADVDQVTITLIGYYI